ncbi:MAG: hypothetical protein HY270_18550 [Deltaproteobacteria bacterium]|nr:hypothetical protein [Deltaproteobacteria bacterium]
MVKDLNPGEFDSDGIESPADVDGQLFFVAPFTLGTSSVWRSDGSEAGTIEIASFPVGSIHGIGRAGRYYCLLQDTPSGSGLLVTDGTPPAGQPLKTFSPGLTPGATGNAGDHLYFTLSGNSVDNGVWTTDGSVEGTRKVAPFAADHFLAVGDTMFFTTGGLWRSDGTVKGTMPLCPICTPGAPSGGLTYSNGKFFFSIETVLGVSDGTVAGTSLLMNLRSAACPLQPVALGNSARAIFEASGLWVTDGTIAGTNPLATISGSPTSFPESSPPCFSQQYVYAPVNAGTGVLFSSSNEEGLELWFTDGSVDGTFRLADIDPGPRSSNPIYLTRSGSRIYFSASTKSQGSELWAVDINALPTPPYPPRRPPATASPTLTPRSTASATTKPPVTATIMAETCPGDCNHEGAVTIDELILGVNIALGIEPSSRCPAFDINGDGETTIDELLAAVNAALDGC